MRIKHLYIGLTRMYISSNQFLRIKQCYLDKKFNFNINLKIYKIYNICTLAKLDKL